MPRFIQSLENRVLMSASSATLVADANAVISDGAATKRALATFKAAEVVSYEMIAASLQTTDTKSDRVANNKLVSALLKAANASYAKILAADNRFLLIARSDSLKGAGDGKALITHPTKAHLQSSVAKDIAALNSIPPAKLATLEAAIMNALAAVDTAYTNIATANPSLASAAQSDESDVATQATAFSAAGNKVVTDIARLALHLGGPSTPIAGATPPTVTSITPMTSTDQDVDGVEVTFSEDINPATFTPSEVSVVGPGGAVSSSQITISQVDAHTFDVNLPVQTQAGTYNVSIGPDIADVVGNTLSGAPPISKGIDMETGAKCN